MELFLDSEYDNRSDQKQHDTALTGRFHYYKICMVFLYQRHARDDVVEFDEH
jgi:hypothetical protein